MKTPWSAAWIAMVGVGAVACGAAAPLPPVVEVVPQVPAAAEPVYDSVFKK